jgi:asparagine synthase (glutamine-hydrolysing)
MCGIAGVFSTESRVNRSDLEVMSKVLAHRGPDGEGFYFSDKGDLGLMHRRLSIIDLSSNASQPMYSADRRYIVVFNGEIYNYRELRQDLLNEGYQFKTASDTEVLLALYDQKKENCLSYIDGMFAFALWDTVENQLFLARDRFGEKPLFYTRYKNAFCFASEMKALFALGVSKEFLPTAIHEYLAKGALFNPDDREGTFYKDIKQLDASTFMIVRNGEIKVQSTYWSLNDVSLNQDLSFNEAKSTFTTLLEESVKLRLRSDVTVGSSLSGGIDSSAIVLMANKAKLAGQEQNTFSARFKNFSKDEGVYIDKVVKSKNDIRGHTVWPTETQLLEDLEDLVYHQEEPFTSSSIYAQYSVMRLARENDTTVLLDGQGADEQLGGYLHYYSHYLTCMITNSPTQFLKERRAYQTVHSATVPYRIPRRLPLWIMKKVVLGQEYRYDMSLRELLINDTTKGGLRTLLRYADRNSMAFSREVRLPFLSHKLVEFIFSLPTAFILHQGWTKYILRKSVEDIVPAEIVWRKEKIGYEPPQDNWLHKLRPIIEDYKRKTNYLDFTSGKPVSDIDDWKWLMLKSFIN